MNVFEIAKSWSQPKKYLLEYTFKDIDSTNTQAKKKFSPHSEIELYLAETQNAGKGRGTNTWVSPDPGSALLSTWVKYLDKAPTHLTSMLVGLSLFRACETVYKKAHFSLKAPNDLYLANKKVAGLLIETIQQGNHYQLIIGLGLNLLSHPEEIDTATHINSAKKTKVNKKNTIYFLEEFLRELEFSWNKLTSQTLESYDKLALLRALNNNPNKTQDFLDIQNNGDIKGSQSTINWEDL